ncbi:MAG: extracellular solute-binding protein [Proteobacteria bacterium]|nr:extracellular solute-binding protein [Pseudomonadota bacterium]
MTTVPRKPHSPRKHALTSGLGALGLGALLGLSLAQPALGWSVEEAAAPYKGSELKVGIAFVPVMEGLLPLMKEFGEKTGIKVKIEQFTHGEWDAKGDADLYSRTGYFDLLMMHHNRAQDWAGNGHVRWINDLMNDPKLRDPDLDPDDFLQPLWDDYCLFEGGKLACYPFMNFQMVYWFRKDFMEDAGERAAFKAKYGYDLAPAVTFTQYRDIAEFFTRKKGETIAGTTLEENHYGVGVVGKRGPSLTWEWYNILNGWGAPVFDADGKPSFENDKVLAATKWWLSLREFAPPGVAEAGFIDLFVLMTKGNIAQAIQWVDFAFAIDVPAISKAVGVYSYAPVPRREASMAPGGWGEAEPLVISKQSKNPEAAYLLMQWLASKETNKRWLEGPGSGLPLRESSLSVPIVREHPVFKPLLSSMKNGWFDPGFTDYIQLRGEIAIQITAAAAGNQSIEEALAKIQARAEKIHPQGDINPGQPHVSQFTR